MVIGKTSRGFALVEFTDRYGAACSLQKSSLAEHDTIWLGVDDAKPKIMSRDAIRLGLPNPGDGTGWVPYPLPDEVSLYTRMHLDREQVKALLPILKRFVKTGEIG